MITSVPPEVRLSSCAAAPAGLGLGLVGRVLGPFAYSRKKTATWLLTLSGVPHICPFTAATRVFLAPTGAVIESEVLAGFRKGVERSAALFGSLTLLIEMKGHVGGGSPAFGVQGAGWSGKAKPVCVSFTYPYVK